MVASRAPQSSRDRENTTRSATNYASNDASSPLSVNDPFDACIRGDGHFWGMMRFGEVSVASHPSFDPAKHLKRQDVFFGSDLDGKPYARLDLLSAKTALAGEIQHIFVVPQPGLCPWSWHSPASTTMPKVMDVLGV
ncbi:hypothetical protein B0H14DRAFT_2563344 [Mycena olivaceomarginata]|nr:hypothetical protein B0H14DRAFT_2563344 [Mycena olivaceomarginata]